MEIIDLLIKTREETLPLYELPAATLKKTYGTGKWSIKKILVHLSDTEDTLMNRVKKTIAENKPVIYGLDPDLWNDGLAYDDYPLSVSKHLYHACRESVIHLAKNYYQNLGTREYVHSETGIRTLKDEFDKIAAHNQSHLNQIKLAIKEEG